MIFFYLFYEFFKIGIFALGGGYATIPFLYRLSGIYPWFSSDELINMIAISNITPGPIGINMATYAGFCTKGILGGITSTSGIILGPFIISVLVIYFLDKFKNSILTQNLMKGLRPASCALLTYVLIELVSKNIFQGSINIKALILTILLFIIYPFIKKTPVLIIIIGGFSGILFNIF